VFACLAWGKLSCGATPLNSESRRQNNELFHFPDRGFGLFSTVEDDIVHVKRKKAGRRKKIARVPKAWTI
jgi:hypothetical protein